MKKDIRTLAALLIASATLVACSSDDNIIEEQPVQPTEKVYTMTIQATKATGDDAATTRGLYWGDGETKKVLNVNWMGTEKVRVVQNGTVIGTLSAAMSSDESTTLTGTVTGININLGIAFYLLAHEDGTMDYTGQKGNIMEENGTGNIEENYDYASYEIKGEYMKDAFNVEGSTIVPKDGTIIPFASQQAIVRFELLNSSGENLYTTKLIVTDKQSGKLVQSYNTLTDTKTYGHVVLTPTNSTASVYFAALNLDDNTSDIRLYALDNSGNLYTYEKSNVTFTKGKYYRVKVKMTTCSDVPLSQITAEDTQFTGWYIGSTPATGENRAYKLYSSGAMAVIAYVGKVPGYWDNFLAMSMHDSDANGHDGEYTANWKENANHVGSYASNHSITIGSTAYTRSFTENIYDQVANSSTTASNTSSSTYIGWRMPTITDWRYIFYGLCGEPSPTDPAGVTDMGSLGSSNPLTKLNADYNGYKANLNEIHYCTSSGAPEISGVSGNDNVWYIKFEALNYGPKTIIYNKSSVNCGLRPVFAY